jgi:glycosyltransferase A (GT-A) superfamily protein (DUF2064 family)
LNSHKLPGLILFTKIPKLGFVKTRLEKSGSLSQKIVTDLQIAMLRDTLHVMSLVKSPYIPLISFYPQNELDQLDSLLESFELPKTFIERLVIQPQFGNSQGLRVENAIKSAFTLSKINYVVIIGADTPQIQPKLLENVLKSLNNQSKIAIIGPSQAGGFYLLALTKFLNNLKKIFDQPDECSNLKNLLINNDFMINFVEEINDIDTFEDLKKVYSKINSDVIKYKTKTEDYHFPKFSFEILKKIMKA